MGENYCDEYENSLNSIKNKLLDFQLSYIRGASGSFKDYILSSKTISQEDKDFVMSYANLTEDGELKLNIIKPQYEEKLLLLRDIYNNVTFISSYDSLSLDELKELLISSFPEVSAYNNKDELLRFICEHYGLNYSYYKWYKSMYANSVKQEGQNVLAGSKVVYRMAERYFDVLDTKKAMINLLEEYFEYSEFIKKYDLEINNSSYLDDNKMFGHKKYNQRNRDFFVLVFEQAMGNYMVRKYVRNLLGLGENIEVINDQLFDQYFQKVYSNKAKISLSSFKKELFEQTKSYVEEKMPALHSVKDFYISQLQKDNDVGEFEINMLVQYVGAAANIVIASNSICHFDELSLDEEKALYESIRDCLQENNYSCDFENLEMKKCLKEVKF